mgnify:CR=1 FL=1
MVHQVTKAIVLHIHAIDIPVGCLENALGKVVTNKTVNTKNEYFFHLYCLVLI